MPKTIDERFAEYDNKHPEIWEAFEAMTLKLIKKGKRHYSADMVFHEIRFETRLSGKPDDTFKINNDFVSRYSRKFLDRHHEHHSFFETRKLSSERNDKKAA